jgi:hypothetical protein
VISLTSFMLRKVISQTEINIYLHFTLIIFWFLHFWGFICLIHSKYIWEHNNTGLKVIVSFPINNQFFQRALNSSVSHCLFFRCLKWNAGPCTCYIQSPQIFETGSHHVKSRLTWNSWSSCLSLLSAEITGMPYPTCFSIDLWYFLCCSPVWHTCSGLGP